MTAQPRSLPERGKWAAVLIVAALLGELVPDTPYAQLFWLGYVLAIAVVCGILISSKASVDGVGISALRAIIAIAIVVHLVMGPPYYRGRPIHARVVQVADGRPVPNAMVDVRWQFRRFSGIEGDQDAGLMRVDRATTDANGEFEVPAWGPVVRPPFRWLAYNAPVITVSSDGHVLADVQNGVDFVRRNGNLAIPPYRQNHFASARMSEWSGFEIRAGDHLWP